MSSDQSPIILAYSGGLDTSFCVPWLKATYGRDVITATIDTGGIDASAAEDLAQRALALGAIDLAVDSVDIMAYVLDGIRFVPENIHLDEGIFATAEAYQLVADEGMPFRDAYRRIARRYAKKN